MNVRPRVSVLHGVNLDQLGRRDPEHYGSLTLRELETRVEAHAAEVGLVPQFLQTNHEGELVEHLHRLEGRADGVLINAGAWTHYAWALRDALEVSGLPAVEVHLSDVGGREPWRRVSVFDGLCVATVSGEGPDGYRRALGLLRDHLEEAGVAAPLEQERETTKIGLGGPPPVDGPAPRPGAGGGPDAGGSQPAGDPAPPNPTPPGGGGGPGGPGGAGVPTSAEGRS